MKVSKFAGVLVFKKLLNRHHKTIPIGKKWKKIKKLN